jgi:membrane fusion protein (multidrug efflux system)
MLQAAEVDLQRQSELFKEKLGSQRDYDRARFNLEAMGQEVEKVKHELGRTRARVEADELSISRMELRSPFDGIVSRRYARTGELLLPDAKVMRVTELRPLLVRFTVPEPLRQAAREGAVLEVAPADSSAPGVTARVIRTGYVVDAASGAVECTARLVEPVPDSLVPGMAVEVKIPGAGGAAQAIAWIPRAAVHRTAGGSGEIFAVQGDRLRKRSVRLGRETESIVQVTGGLNPGDKIAAQFSEKLQDGMAVRVRP